MAEKKKILFVCVGNTCRSPMAAAYCSFKYNGMTADSAGISTCGSDMHENAKKALELFGINVSSLPCHVSKPVSTELIEIADLVVCVDSDISALLRFYYPLAKDRIIHFSPAIPDPYGGTAEVYAACLALMAEQIDKIVSEL